MTDRIYADNAATSFPKPPEVMTAMQNYAAHLGASAGRGAYREAIDAGELLTEGRRLLARLINTPSPDAIVYTHNCSMALNLAIHGILRDGDHVVATMMEHNSVLRPLHLLLAENRIRVTWVAADSRTGIVDPGAIRRALQPDTRLVCVNHGSNVTGTVQRIDAIGDICKSHGAAFLVDAAQTIGHMPIDVLAAHVDLLAFPGHKALMGPLGTGALYIRPGLESDLRPLLQGGTGSISEQPEQPEFMPDRFEPGSHNAIGIAGLVAALKWIESKGIDALTAHDRALSERFLDATASISGLKVFGPNDVAQRVAVFSVAVEGLEAAELAAILESEFGILTRPGIHCAPFAHKTIGTDQCGGTTRLSFGALNTPTDIDRCVAALNELAKSQAAANA
ncbi:MAG: aminotransferase class V-fold PLP-dependent enzyme [Phycisphaerales bacterium]|nr:aminotransferase class V-fold PLP-dependent enzyme [Phycisphaerales bacterium]MCB9857658.1 aminotransferase class V-fold PLP-dependent enzyme [Phycisphaerales bacterium]